MGNQISALATTVTRRYWREAAGGDGASSNVAAATSVKSQVPDDDVDSTEPYIDQCGLDPDPEGNWVEATPDPRIKESLLTPEEKAKFRGHLETIFHPETINGVRVKFEANDVVEVMEKVIPYLASEPMLIEDVPFDITIVADLHGQLYDLKRIFNEEEKDGKPAWENMKYLFLGDYVDRGRQGLEIVMALFCIKMLYPDRIFILRGNHEFVHTNCKNGTTLDFVDRWPEGVWQAVYFKMNEAFCWLSCAAIVGNIYFCAHGGISPAAFTRRHLLNVMKPITASRQDVLIHDTVWSDPAKGLQGTTFNGRRGCSIYYGLDTLSLALYNMDCLALFRGHTIQPGGYDIIGHLCFSLFSATGAIENNDAAVAVIAADGTVELVVFECNPERVRWVNTLKYWDGGKEVVGPVDEDTVTQYDEEGSGTVNLAAK